MSFKEKLLNWLIRPERYYIDRYVSFLRKEEHYTFNKRNSIMAFWYKARKNRLGSRLGFIISAGCFGEGLQIEHYGSIIVNPKARIGRNCKIHGNCCIGSTGGYPDDPEDTPTTLPSSATMWTSAREARFWAASVLPTM